MTSDERYAAAQRQRAMERAVRGTKRRIAVGQSEGLDMAADRYLLGRQQARLAAHVKANRLTRDYSRERAYGVDAQPQALTATVAVEMRERFIPRDMPAKGTAYDVARKAVNGAAYREKFDACGLPKRAARAAYTEARAILRDRDGTDRERMSVVAWSTGYKVTDTFGAQARVRWCSLTEGQYLRVSRVQGGVVLLHNHPASTRPSFSDMRALAENRFVRASLVLGHDGSLWALSDVKPSVVGRSGEILSRLQGRFGGMMSAEDVEARALDVLYEENEGKKWFRMKRL